jgi:hypothetical protein
MGKKRSFKRSDDKKGQGSGSNSSSTPEYFPRKTGMIDPTYVDNRGNEAPPDFGPQHPPTQMTATEIWEQRNAARLAAEASEKAKAAAETDGAAQTNEESLEENDHVVSRRQKVSQSDPTNASVSVENFSEIESEMEAQGNQEQSGESASTVVPMRKKKRLSEIIEELKNDVELESTRRQLVAGAWRARDKVYQQLFGKPAYVTPANYEAPSEEVPEGFATRDTSQPDIELDEEKISVLAYGPDPQAPYWKYVTAGIATPWVQYEPLQVSGFGCELMIKTPTDAPWAAPFLRTLAFYIFNQAGTVSQGVRLALNSSIDPGHSDSQLRNAFVWYADEAPDTLYELPSGLFSINIVVGMTDDERAFADSIEEYGTWSLQALLRQAGHEQVTDPKRQCAMEHENINAMKMSVRNFAETFRANRAGLFTVDDTML